MGQSRVITVKVNEVPIQITIEADKEDVYRRAESRLRMIYIDMANKLGNNTNNIQVLSRVAYELMIRSFKLQEELKATELKIEQTLSKEGKL
ncbi:MAG: hypothetical protein MJ009_06605 [Paludibacteraceae bacterium]|nr:hypothetical protein [Paludibacteraceae bacterium]